MKLQKAERHQVKLRIGLSGPSQDLGKPIPHYY